MKKFRLILPTLAVIAFAALPSHAQDKSAAMSTAAIKAKIEWAQREDERLIIKLKNGKSISGSVMMQDADSFTVTATHEPFGGGDSTMVLLSDVQSVKGRNPFVKGVKAAGDTALIVALVPIVLPIWLVSALVHHPVLGPCTSGSMH